MRGVAAYGESSRDGRENNSQMSEQQRQRERRREGEERSNVRRIQTKDSLKTNNRMNE